MVEVKKKLKILCLHGYRQNEILFREKTGGLRKAVKSLADFEFISAPLIPKIPIDKDSQCDDDEGNANTELGPRGWWFSKVEETFSSRDICDIATGFDQSVKEVIDYIKEKGPFDGLLGFSQGASMVHLLTSMGCQNKIPLNWKFIIMMSSFKSLSSVHRDLVEYEIKNMPSLQIYGESDQVVYCERSEELCKLFKEPEPCVIKHSGGHCVPPMSAAKDLLREFLKQFI
uniref:FSH1 domain-containing protein n=1 Tax=Strongyloides stercoralis TaxID=6248 RepID=A0A0K0DU88_STRER